MAGEAARARSSMSRKSRPRSSPSTGSALHRHHPSCGQRRCPGVESGSYRGSYGRLGLGVDLAMLRQAGPRVALAALGSLAFLLLLSLTLIITLGLVG
ncbi:MAG: hypothetical protein M1389_04200 [Chloroflexi bacterium]|nr:hypothetical protein [Chloroflexota bacterium]MDA8216107.1 hypothetical protein [Dehalococcoidales bacterium]